MPARTKTARPEAPKTVSARSATPAQTASPARTAQPSRFSARQAINRVAAKKATAPINADFSVVVRPSVRDRWSSASLSNYTPDRIQSVLRSVAGGSFMAQWELFELMEDTWPRLKKNLNELKRAVQKADLLVVPFPNDKKPSDLAKKKADVLRAAINGTLPSVPGDENSWEDAIYDACDAVGKGISIQEILWEVRAGQAGESPLVLPKAFQWVYPRHFGYWVDQPDLLLDPVGDGSRYAPFPDDKFIIATFKTKTGHLLTSALLRSLATFWIGSNFSYDWALNLAQMFGIPIRWATYDPTDPNLLNDICDMLENMGSAGWGAFPAGTTLELKEAVQRAADNPQAFLLELADVACDILILGQTLTTSQGARGALALGRVHQDVRAEVIDYVASWVAKVFNYQFVPALMRLNFGHNNEDPYLVPDIEGQRDALQMAQRDEIIVSKMQVPVTKRWFYERHDIPIPEDGDEILEVPVTNVPDPAGADPNTARFVSAKAAESKLVDHVMEDLTGVEARWLGGVKPFFAQLLEYAKSDQVTDAELLRTIEESRRVMPDLFPKMRSEELATALDQAMTAALVNGVSKGFMNRRGGSPSRTGEEERKAA